jgi:hypothetical protein
MRAVIVGVTLGLLSAGSIISVLTFFLALITEASVGFGYPFAFRAAVWSALSFAICTGGMLLLI